MNKVLPYIILGALVLVIIWIAYRQKKQANQQMAQSGQFTGGSPSGTSTDQGCVCEQDPEIQNKVQSFNMVKNNLMAPIRDEYIRHIKEACPCIKL